VVLEPYVERHPLTEAPKVFEDVAQRRIKRRAILVP